MNLDDWRSRINDLDNQILDLLTQRAEAALQIGDLKRRQDAPSYAPEREADIVRRLTEQNDGPLAAEAVVAVWREILSGCRALEAALTVAYLGPQATFTHEAALQHFGAAATYRPARSDRKSTRLNSSHGYISYAVFCLKKKNTNTTVTNNTTSRCDYRQLHV